MSVDPSTALFASRLGSGNLAVRALMVGTERLYVAVLRTLNTRTEQPMIFAEGGPTSQAALDSLIALLVRATIEGKR